MPVSGKNVYYMEVANAIQIILSTYLVCWKLLTNITQDLNQVAANPIGCARVTVTRDLLGTGIRTSLSRISGFQINAQNCCRNPLSSSGNGVIYEVTKSLSLHKIKSLLASLVDNFNNTPLSIQNTANTVPVYVPYWLPAGVRQIFLFRLH